MNTNSKELYHHGILGMKWGVRNGPPYPLDSKSHSSSEKKAGWRKSLNKKNTESDDHKKYREYLKKDPRSLSNIELNYVNDRYNKIKNFNRIKHTTSVGHQFIDKLFNNSITKNVGKILVATASGAIALGTKKYILDIVDNFQNLIEVYVDD